ncbi:MAG: PqqD family peptide modification chaperone, partial [Gammaproteobacteria bacterium]|nr:PqqD family peptide modification chaperone [Gammaproteobacteria bacterium]
PALRAHTKIHRHMYRGAAWFVIQDLAAGRVHRFSPSAYRIIASMDGRRTVDDIWQAVDDELGDQAPTQDDIVQLLAKLHSADLLLVENPADNKELFKRFQNRRSSGLKQRFMNPMAIRLPLLDPDRLLDRLLPFVRPVFSGLGFAAWAVIVGFALLLVGMHWAELTENVSDRVLNAQNLFLIWLAYPFIKLLHELGHGLAVKRWRGEVHEMGIMLLVLAPVPYVDASAAAAFKDKTKRMMVGAAGIMVELFVAALAMFVWVAVEPGIVRSVAFNLMLIGGISTVVFNGNPLLRFDAYYVLADFLAMPNLAARSNKYIGYLLKRHAFGIENCESPAADPGERPWLAGYAVLSFIYRMIVLFGIVMFISSKFFVVGILLAIWAIGMQIALPLIKHVMFLLADPGLSRERPRALAVVGSVCLIAVAVFVWVPMPLSTQAQGVVWAPDKSEVRAGADGVVVQLLTLPDSAVEAGMPLLMIEDPLLAHRVRILEADVREAEARYVALRTSEPVQAAIVLDELNTIREDLALARTRLKSLTVQSKATGNFLVEQPRDLVNRYVRNGDLIGYISDNSNGRVRVAVTQEDIGLIRERTDAVWVRLTEQLDRPVKASVTRAVPAAMDRLPSPVLGTTGGGPVPVDPSDEQGTRTLDNVFHIELEIPTPVPRIGGRAY